MYPVVIKHQNDKGGCGAHIVVRNKNEILFFFLSFEIENSGAAPLQRRCFHKFSNSHNQCDSQT